MSFYILGLDCHKAVVIMNETHLAFGGVSLVNTADIVRDQVLSLLYDWNLYSLLNKEQIDSSLSITRTVMYSKKGCLKALQCPR
jgi:hypothetical protein